MNNPTPTPPNKLNKLSFYYTNVDNSLLSKIDELRIKTSVEKYDIVSLN
jgi:hypothetical protein